MTEKYNNHEFDVFEMKDAYPPCDKYYYYRIYVGDKDYIESYGDMFDSYNEAKHAAIGHISLIEEGETP